jgi:hypothetical protein
VPALGGTRHVPAPDPIARAYLELALRLDQRIPGFVDGYFGPADIKAATDMAQLPSPARLREDARTLRSRLADEVSEDARRRWLDAQLIAFEAHARSLAGDPLPYLDHVAACFDWRPIRRPEALFVRAAEDLDGLLPGGGSGEPATLAERLVAWDAALTISPDRLPAVVDWLVDQFRERARTLFGLPEGESLTVRVVRNQPWSGYNWYDGGLRSRVDLNLDLPIRAGGLLRVVAHETYFGHHLEHAWKEADRVEGRGELEASLLAINAPECLISEGLADLGYRFAAPPPDEADILAELIDRAGLPVASDRVLLQEVAQRQVAVGRAQETLRQAGVNAALMRHVDGIGHEDVRAWLIRSALLTPEQAEKRLEFIEHPLWRTYVYVYSEGEALLRRWLEAVPDEAQPARYGRLLHEALTPSAIATEIDRPPPDV